jgi:hypothetical protein
VGGGAVKIDPEKERVCSKCGEVRDILMFEPIKCGRYRRGKCRKCRTNDLKSFISTEKGAELKKVWDARWYLANTEKQKAYGLKWRTNNSEKAKLTAKRYLFQKKKRAVDFMGGTCVGCGYNKCIAALEFHHKDPSIKSGNSTQWLKWPWEKQVIELSTCILVCSNCHREIHAGMRKDIHVPPAHNTINARTNKKPALLHKRFKPWDSIIHLVPLQKD